MSQTDKIRVAVLYGGRSGEHEISLASATNVIQHLDRNRFEVVPIGIDKKGVWFLGEDILQKKLKLHCDEDRKLFQPDSIGKSIQFTQPSQLLMQQTRQGKLFDVIFPVIHGPLCEDGTVQGLLELAEVPYVGCGVLSSAIGMDKDVSKRLIQGSGIPVPNFLTTKKAIWNKDPVAFALKVNKQLTYPLFVKPANTGSSVGIHKVKEPVDLNAAIQNAFLYDTKVIIEQGMTDFYEIEVAVLESLQSGEDPIVSIPGEIRPKAIHEFYSYASKYLDEEGAELIIPAPISHELQLKIRKAAKTIFIALECEGMARVDLFLEKKSQRIYFNEINTIPGFTQISMYPKLMTASGFSYPELLTHLVMLAIDKHTQKSQLAREYVSNLKKHSG